MLSTLALSFAFAQNAPFPDLHDINDVDYQIWTSVWTADLDGDGQDEVIMKGGKNDFSEGLTWLKLNEDGTFDQHQVDPAMMNANYVEVLDFDGDGDTDIVAYSDGDVSGIDSVLGYWWYENTDGGRFFVPHAIFEEAFEGPFAVGDMDGDGTSDLVVSDEDDMYVLYDRGGSYDRERVPSHQQYKYMPFIEVGDMNGDGHMDIMTAYEEDFFELLLQQADGSFTQQNLDPSRGIIDVKVVDIDADGDLDMLGMGRLESLIYFNSGGAQFFKEVLEDSGNLITSVSMTAADYDGDGDLDILRNRYDYDDGIALFDNDGGDFLKTSIIGWTPGDDQNSIALGDLDCDGDLDLVVSGAEQDDWGLAWLESNLGGEPCAAGGGTGGGPTGPGTGDPGTTTDGTTTGSGGSTSSDTTDGEDEGKDDEITLSCSATGSAAMGIWGLGLLALMGRRR